MAKPKARMGRPPKGGSVTNFQMRVSVEWLEWLDRIAKSRRVNRTTLVDHAIATFASIEGLGAPPPRIE